MCCACSMVCVDPGCGAGNCFLTRLALIVMGPILCVAVYDARNINIENLEKVGYFDVVNECGDQYTKISSGQITAELQEASRLINTIFIF